MSRKELVRLAIYHALYRLFKAALIVASSLGLAKPHYLRHKNAKVNPSAWGQFGSAICGARKNAEHHEAVWGLCCERPTSSYTSSSLCRVGEIRQGTDGCSNAGRGPPPPPSVIAI